MEKRNRCPLSLAKFESAETVLVKKNFFQNVMLYTHIIVFVTGK